MKSGSYHFDLFSLDVEDRTLRRNGEVCEVSNRYFDALVLLVSEAGSLVSKNRFMDDVWRGVPVTDEALTQCIRALRRELGDDAARPRFIETVPKHGYRFVAPVETGIMDSRKSIAPSRDWQRVGQLGGAGVAGGGLAGLLGGIFYGFIGAAQPLSPAMGAGSIVLVLTAISVLVGLLGALGVSFGIAAAQRRNPSWQWTIAGGALGGLVIGGVTKLLGLDAFNLLLGQAPRQITGAFEGAVIGGAVGLGVWLGGRNSRHRVWPSALIGSLAGFAITGLGGRMLGGSLDQLALIFPQSRLRLNQIGALFGEDGFGPVSQMVTGALEGGLFAACVTSALLLARRQFRD